MTETGHANYECLLPPVQFFLGCGKGIKAARNGRAPRARPAPLPRVGLWAVFSVPLPARVVLRLRSRGFSSTRPPRRDGCLHELMTPEMPSGPSGKDVMPWPRDLTRHAAPVMPRREPSPTVVRCGSARRGGYPARACGARVVAEEVDVFPLEYGRASILNISCRNYRNGHWHGRGFLRSRKLRDHLPRMAASTVLPSISVAVVVPKTSSVLAVVHGGALSYCR